MKPRDILSFTFPDGHEIKGVIIMKCSDMHEVGYGNFITSWLCYAQNQLFTIKEILSSVKDAIDLQKGTAGAESISYEHDKVIIDYVVIPEYDNLLNNN